MVEVWDGKSIKKIDAGCWILDAGYWMPVSSRQSAVGSLLHQFATCNLQLATDPASG